MVISLILIINYKILHTLHQSQTKQFTYHSHIQMLARPVCCLLPINMYSSMCALISVRKDRILATQLILSQTIHPFKKKETRRRRAEQKAGRRVTLDTERNGWWEEGNPQQIPCRKSLGIITSHDYPSIVSHRASAEDKKQGDAETPPPERTTLNGRRVVTPLYC